MKKLGFLFFILLTSGIACKTKKGPRAAQRDVPIAINIEAENNATTNFVNLDYYRLQLLNEIDQFQSVNFVLVEQEDNPEVILDLTIENFTLWPKDERVSRRRVSRNVVAGTDPNGKPIYQTVTASIDIIQVQRRSNARFKTTITIPGDPPFKFQKSFFPQYNYSNTYIDNIQGDPRALDPSISMSRGMGFEPEENDFLLILSKQEMVRRLSDELRKYYDTNTKSPK